jgi:predicted nucleic acid-binding protein
VTALVVDSSVVLKWFHATDEPEVEESRALLAAHQSGDVEALVLDLAFYELGNVLSRSLQLSASNVAGVLEDLASIVGTPLVCNVEDLAAAAQLAAEHGLTFYDAAWAAVAVRAGAVLVTADVELIRAGLGESPATVARSLGLL